MKVVIAKVDEIYFDGEASSITLPGQDGVLTVLPKHMPLVTTLKAGEVLVRMGRDEQKFHIDGGVLEVHRDGATVVL